MAPDAANRVTVAAALAREQIGAPAGTPWLVVHTVGAVRAVPGLQVGDQVPHLAPLELWPRDAGGPHDFSHFVAVIPHGLRDVDGGEVAAVPFQTGPGLLEVGGGSVADAATLRGEDLASAPRVSGLTDLRQIVAIGRQEGQQLGHLPALEHGHRHLQIAHLLAHDRPMVPERARQVEDGPRKHDATQVGTDRALARPETVALHTAFLGEQPSTCRWVIRQFHGKADERRGRRGLEGCRGLRLAGDGGDEQQRDEDCKRAHQASRATGTA